MPVTFPSRRAFLQGTASSFIIVPASGGLRARATGAQSSSGSPAAQLQPPTRADPLAPGLVKEFVQKAHADLPGTKAFLAEEPALLNATWDWGGGDFETGLGGAGHMGNREIAEYLIGQGARLDIFVAAMLGRLEIVRALLDAWPALIASRGAHGISLLRHARAGGERSEPVVALLIARGAQ